MDEEYNPYVVITSDDDVFREALRARDLFPREDPETCVKCSEGRLVCDASCKEADGWVCKQVVKVDNCKECPTTKCVQQAQSDSSTSGNNSSTNTSSGPNTGVIVGAVIGGVVGIAAITYLIWRFCIKNKRQPIAPTTFDDVSEQKAEEKDDFQTRRGQRESMHTIHSIASTVLTRASNIIQIAYIPGVTNRTTPSSPNVLVPPVPPIPIGLSGAHSPGNYEDQHFFMPGDLRDSTYSAMTGYTDRTSFARTSYAPRSSVASTIYGKNAVVSTPQTGMRAKPAMISVRSGGTGSSGTATPPVPNVDYEKYNPRPKSRDSTFSIGSAFMKNASAATATPVKAQLVRVASGKRVNVKKSDGGGASPNPSAPSTRSPLAHTSGSPTIVEDSQSEDAFEGEGPFLDPPESVHDRLSHASSPSLSAVIEEATRRAAQVGKPNSMARETSPFGDEHATKD